MIIGFLCVVILFLIFKPKIVRFFEIDSCLDKGGRWNYEKNICETLKQDSFSLKGAWIYQDSACFEIIEISDTNDVMFTSYVNNKKSIGELDKDFFHYYYKSKGELGFFNSNTIWISTDKYRFDYFIRGDTLEEFDKMGLQKKLVRIHETDN
jgi:hypothetical protein